MKEWFKDCFDMEPMEMAKIFFAHIIGSPFQAILVLFVIAWALDTAANYLVVGAKVFAAGL